MKSILVPHTGILQFCKRIKLNGADSFLSEFNDALINDEEGVVIKKHNSTYKPGQRSSSGWYKLKPDYVHGLTNDFDLIVLGIFFDRTKSYVNSYLVGVIESPPLATEQNPDPNNSIFHSVAKISLGLDKFERRKINDSLRPHFKTCNCPYRCGTLIPHAWIEPQNSIIFEIKATELYLSSEFSTNYTLRFPRIQRIRDDKSWYDCMTLQEFDDLQQENAKVKKISKRKLMADDLETANKIKSIYSNPYISSFRSEDVAKVTNAFEGIKFCISSGNKLIKIDDIKKMVVKHQGEIVANPLLDTSKCIVIAGDLTRNVRNLIDTKLYNIVSVDWLIRCFTSDVITENFECEPKPREIISATPKMEEKLKMNFDQFGDSYTSHVDLIELQLLLKELDNHKIPKRSKSELDELRNELNI